MLAAEPALPEEEEAVKSTVTGGKARRVGVGEDASVTWQE